MIKAIICMLTKQFMFVKTINVIIIPKNITSVVIKNVKIFCRQKLINIPNQPLRNIKTPTLNIFILLFTKREGFEPNNYSFEDYCFTN
jgi:hypothetical protein